MTVSRAATKTPSTGLPRQANTPVRTTTSCAMATTAAAPNVHRNRAAR